MFKLIKHTPHNYGHDIWHSDMTIYWISWLSIFCLALLIAFLHKNEIQQSFRGYLQFLKVPWKLTTFYVAFLFVTFAGYWTNDETWDIVTGAGMSIFAFANAPLAVGIWIRFFCFKFDYKTKPGIIRQLKWMLLALVFSLFSYSWFYDGYLMIRDGSYSIRWYGNLILSGFIYMAAGLFWNLEVTSEKYISFGFFREDWPMPPENKSYLRLLVLAIPLAFFASYFLVGFVRWV
ncbi:MAG: hypothetical protein AAF518_25440 [Spirochaetota bacterium]